MTTSKIKGEISESIIIAEFLKLGFSVSIPFGDNQKYDIIVDMGGVLKRVQVKTARLRDNCVRFNLCNSANTKIVKEDRRQNYKNTVEYIAAYCPDNDECYLVEPKQFGDYEASLRLVMPRNNQKAGIKFAEDYLLARSVMVNAST